ncbi:MAG: glycosyltransferase [Cyanobium sp.]|nr:glycosyltransferase [Cyanobium sp.]
MTDPTAYSILIPLAPWEPVQQVRETLASIEQQTLAPSQVVVSCDGTPTAALSELLLHSSLPLLMVHGPGKEGVGPVLNRGLQRCREELVLRVDADDICMPERSEIQVAAMLQRPELMALSTPVLEFLESSQSPLHSRITPMGSRSIRKHSKWRNPMNHPAVILRKTKILELGGYRDCPGFEDYDLWLRILKRGDFLDNLSLPLVKARIGSGHLARRHGMGYLRKEWAFLWGCGRIRTLSWPRVALLILLRTPIRIAPSSYQQWLTKHLLRRGPQ